MNTWAHRSVYRRSGWDFGFYAKPWPDAHQTEGEMLKALIHIEAHISIRPWRWALLWRCDGFPPKA